MDLLSAIGLVTKRRGDYFSQAESLAKKYKTQEKLEQRMADESRVLVKGFRDKQMRWAEYERSLIDKTLVSALASVYLGGEGSNPKDKMGKAWSPIVGDMLPPLMAFLDETKSYIEQGLLKVGDQTEDFADEAELEDVLTDPENPSEFEIKDPAKHAAIVASSAGGIGRSWRGVVSRVVRYLSTPTYGYYNLGKFMVKNEQGFKEMRRVARVDKKTCEDCLSYNRSGWKPLGELPMPGHGCQCYDRCRCYVEYR